MIPIRFQYKRYPNAPKATRKSQILNILLSVPYRAIYSFFLAAIVGYVLWASETAYLFAFVLLIPFNLLLSAYKKRRERAIDRLAQEEARNASA